MNQEELSEPDKIKEGIKFRIEQLRLSLLGLLTIGGGTISLVVEGVFTGRNNFFIAGGILLILLSIMSLLDALKKIKRPLK